jgi:TPR repeat protein
LRNLAASALASVAIASTVLAQTGQPTVPPDLQAAMAKAHAGAPDDLVKLADGGRADAQYYAGLMFLSPQDGSPGGAPIEGARGCAYEAKASASRADAMYMVGECYKRGLGGTRDADKAKAAFVRAAEMGYPNAKCALGEMLMAEPGQAARGLDLCKETARAGDANAQVMVGDVYFTGGAVKSNHAEAAKWYAMAAKLQNPQAARKLGTMYSKGDGVRRDPKRAMELWLAAEKSGDPLVCILVADQLFSDLTGGRTPGPGTYAFRGGIPVQEIDVAEDWYREAQKRDPRPDVQKRAKLALHVLASFKTPPEPAPSK